MSRVRYSDLLDGEEDSDILGIIYNNSSDAKKQKVKKMLMKIIENELTPKQRTAVKEYFFNHLSMSEIAEKQGVSVSAVSATIIAGKRRIYKFMKYCMGCDAC